MVIHGLKSVRLGITGNRAATSKPEADGFQWSERLDKFEHIQGFGHILVIASGKVGDQVGNIGNTQLFTIFDYLKVVKTGRPLVEFF
jgi:hypothetical protein